MLDFLKFVLLAAALGQARTSYGQASPVYKRTEIQAAEPIYLLNSTTIINGLMTSLKPQEITNIVIYKSNTSPPHVPALGLAGIVSLTSSKQITSDSFAQLGQRLGLQGPLRFAINGYRLPAGTETTLRIAPEAIAQLHILRPTTEQPETIVDVWTTVSKPSDSRQNPPGTIMLR